MEAVLLSVTPSYVVLLEQKAHPSASTLRALKQDVDKPLGAILTLNTFAHTIGAAGAGAEAEKVFGGGTPTVIFAGVLTLLILVASEIIPKTLGAKHWKRLSPLVAKVLNSWFMRFFGALSKGLTRLFFSEHKAATVSREEFTAMAELVRQQGTIHEHESHILKSLFRFNALTARDVMTPRTVVFALKADQTVAEVMKEHEHLNFSRIPMYSKNRDDATGYVLRREIIYEAARDQHETRLEALKRPFVVVQENISVQVLFEQLVTEREHIALVVDEYGGMAGIVTLEDLVETLLGMEIIDEVDTVEDMQELARQQWKKRAERIGLTTKAST
jgi:CBS domain containing-hemolysin-like protein